jgi:hypothetical protein
MLLTYFIKKKIAVYVAHVTTYCQTLIMAHYTTNHWLYSSTGRFQEVYLNSNASHSINNKLYLNKWLL